MVELKIIDSLDHKDDGPQVVRRGRVHRVIVECYAAKDISPEHLEEFISTELGFGGIGPDNPLYNGDGFELRNVIYDRDMQMDGFTLWNAKGDGCPTNERRGTTVHRRPGEPLNFEYEFAQPEKVSE